MRQSKLQYALEQQKQIGEGFAIVADRESRGDELKYADVHGLKNTQNRDKIAYI